MKNILTELDGLKDILIQEGLDIERFKAFETYHDKMDYLINEFFVQSDELMKMFIDAKFSINNFLIILWATRKNKTALLKEIYKKLEDEK